MAAQAGLEGGLLVGADHVLAGAESFVFELAGVEIEDPNGLGAEVGVAGEDPAPMAPEPDGVLRQPLPDGGTGDAGHEAAVDDLGLDVGNLEAGEWQPELRGQLARDRLDRDDQLRGRNRLRPDRSRSSRPSKRCSKNRLRHLLTISRRVSRRSAIWSLRRPRAARSTKFGAEHIAIRQRIFSSSCFQDATFITTQGDLVGARPRHTRTLLGSRSIRAANLRDSNCCGEY